MKRKIGTVLGRNFKRRPLNFVISKESSRLRNFRFFPGPDPPIIVPYEEIKKEVANFFKPGSCLLYLREKTLYLEIMIEPQVVSYLMKRRTA